MKTIRLYVGEVIESNNITYLVAHLLPSGFYTFLNLTTGGRESETWKTFHEKNLYSIKRKGKVGQNILEGDDWICHDHRCYPCDLAGGCFDCPYSKSGSSKKRYYEPGDVVRIIKEKCEGVVENVSLFVKNETGVPIKLIDSWDFNNYTKRAIEFEWSIRFQVKCGETNRRYYRWDELRCIKRKKHALNLEQLRYICSSLCIYGPYDITSTKCFECETGRIRRSAKNKLI